jgi:sec-independent protein translocase protein TatA
MLGGLKLPEIIAIAALLLLFFGAPRLPQLGSSIGAAIRNFKKGFSGDEPASTDEEKASLSKGAVTQQPSDRAKAGANDS